MHRLKPVLIGLIIISIFLYPTLKVGLTGIKLISVSKTTLNSTQNYTQNLFIADKNKQTQQAQQLKTNLQQLHLVLTKFNHQTQTNWLAQKIIANKKNQLELAPDLISIAQKLLTGQQTYALLFQNTEELRASGGFLGSYAKIKLNNGVLMEFKIEDIYVPDGQFNWFIEAPVGVKKYLSGGEGLRLRDANWHPDFPTSAQQILTYLAFGREAGLDGAVAINLPVVKKILTITGPIYLHDYDQIVTSNNFSDIARADRGDFFPGSIQKQHFLSIFFNQLLIKLQALNQKQQLQLINELASNAIKKDLQFFSNDHDLQTLFEKLNISGQLKSIRNAAYLTLVESNVGINKANQHLDRAVDLKISTNKTLIEVTFVNRNLPPNFKNNNPNEANHLGYVNYQRLILSPETKIKKIIFDKQEITDWDEELISNSNGEIFKQIGFLLTVAEKETKKLIVELNHSILNGKTQIFIQKQAGVDIIPYHIQYHNQELSLDLTKDTLVNLDN